MEPKEIAARFAAFTWHINCRQAPTKTAQAEARRFSNESWRDFLTVAHEGLGKLLLKVAKTHPHCSHHGQTWRTARRTRRTPVASV